MNSANIKSAKKYRPNLVELMNLSEVNYMLLMRLMRKKVGLRIIDKTIDEQKIKDKNNEEVVGEKLHFFISDLLAYTITINEVTRYTSVVTMAQDAMVQNSPAKNTTTMVNKLSPLFRPVMMVRLYHDARMVEILSSQDVRQIKPRYDYPNEAMFHQDEKRQLSLFLKEWLHLCLQQGQVNISFEPKL